MLYPIYFTLDEARTILPQVEDNVRKLQRCHHALEFLSSIEIENEEGDPELDVTITQLNMNYYKKLYLYHKYLGTLLSLGAVIKNLSQGLVDFYAKHEERDILLCWKLGEKDIEHWHEIEGGFGGRQPVALLEPQLRL